MTALEGEDLALSESDDLIILDIMLPKKDGLAVLKSLREEGPGDAGFNAHCSR